MKIAIDARFIYTSTGRYVERLIHYLQQLDTRHEYVILLSAKDYDRWEPLAPNFTKMVADFKPYTFAEQIQFAALLRRLKPDLVHFTMPQQPVIYSGKKITTVHDLTLIDFVNQRKESFVAHIYKHILKPAVFKFVMWWVIRTSRLVIVPTKFVRQQISDRYHTPPARLLQTYEAADKLAASETPIARVQGKEYVMYVGNAFPYKNLTFLVESFAKLQQDQPSLYLVLAGKTDFFYTELQALVDERKLTNVLILGFISDEELAWLYRGTELFIFPSLSEGFGLPPLEAMTFGVPVLSSSASCMPEVYGDAAEYFDPHDQHDLATKISTLLESKKRRTELSAAALERVKMYSWKRMAEQTLEAYNQLGR